MRYIGLDISSKTGYVEFLNGELIAAEEITSEIETDPIRMIHITTQILNRLDEKDEKPVICIEGFSYNSKGAAADFQYGIGWMVRAELMKAGYDYILVPPGNVKKFACGKGQVKKDALILPIFRHWGFEHDSDNVRDAYILAKMAHAIAEKPKLTLYQQDALKKIVG